MGRTNMVFDDYVKLFKDWFKIKISLWRKESRVVFKQGEIWWCSFGMNLGEEIFGKGLKFTRPVLVFRKFTGNSFLGLPLTTHERKGTWYVEITIHRKTNWVMLNQARILDKKRLTNRIGTLDNADFKKVKESFLEFYKS